MGCNSAWNARHMLLYILLYINFNKCEGKQGNMKKGITFIVPVFNNSKTITRCIRSLVRFRNTYVVAVNDGSTDDSKDVLEKLEAKYDNLNVINTENRGVSSARNKGLEHVETELVGFCDSDDYYQQFNPLDFLDGTAELRVFSFEYKGNRNYPDSHLYSKPMKLSSKQYLEEMRDHFYTLYFGAVWNKIYKTEIIKKYNLRFDESIRYGEDLVFNAEYVKKVNKVAIDPNIICNYFLFRDDEESIEVIFKYYKDTVARLKKFREVCHEMNIDVDQTYYNHMSMELIEPVKYILHYYKKEEAIAKFKELFYNKDVIESLQHYTKDSRRVKLLAKCIPAQKWKKMYRWAKLILIAKGD